MLKNKTNWKNSKIALLMIAVITLIVSTLSLTLAYFTSKRNIENIFNFGTVSLKLVNDSEVDSAVIMGTYDNIVLGEGEIVLSGGIKLENNSQPVFLRLFTNVTVIDTESNDVTNQMQTENFVDCLYNALTSYENSIWERQGNFLYLKRALGNGVDYYDKAMFTGVTVEFSGEYLDESWSEKTVKVEINVQAIQSDHTITLDNEFIEPNAPTEIISKASAWEFFTYGMTSDYNTLTFSVTNEATREVAVTGFATNSQVASIDYNSQINLNIPSYIFTNDNGATFRIGPALEDEYNKNNTNVYKVTSFADNAFANNNLIQTIIIPDTIETIGSSSFSNCANLKSVKFSTSTENKSTYTFGSNIYAEGMRNEITGVNGTVETNSTNTEFTFTVTDQYNSEYERVGISFKGATDTIYPTANLNYILSYELKANAEAHNKEVLTGFDIGNYGLKRVKLSCNEWKRFSVQFTMPNVANKSIIINATDWFKDEVVYVRNFDLKQIQSVAEENIINSVKTINSSAFENDTKLTSVILPEGLETVNESAFSGFRISTLNIPKTLTTIKANAFKSQNLTQVHFNYDNSTNLDIGSTIFGSEGEFNPALYIYLPVNNFNAVKNQINAIYFGKLTMPVVVNFYMSNDFSVEPLFTKTVYYNQMYGALPTASKAHNVFKGWLDENENQVKPNTKVKTIETHNLIASFAFTEYSISYILNGGTINGENVTKFNINSGSTTLINPTKIGSTFLGWECSSNGEKIDALSGTNVTINFANYGKNLIFKALWETDTYKVYLAENENLNSDNITANNINATITKQTDLTDGLPVFVVDYTSMKNGATNDGCVSSNISTSNCNGQKFVLNVWVKSENNVTINNLNIFCDNQDISLRNYTVTNVYTQVTYVFTHNGDSLNGKIGFYTTADSWNSMDKLYIKGLSLSRLANVDSENPFDISYGATHHKLENASREGYTFTKWTRDLAGNNTVNRSTVFTELKNEVLFANYTQNAYEVRLDANGGECEVTESYVLYNNAYGTFNEIGLTTPTKTGYTFGGWFTDNITFENQITNDTIFKETDTTVLYAQWIANKYIVSFNANGGTNETQTLEVIYNEAYGELPTSIREGYNFDGWYTLQVGGELIQSNTKVKTTSNQTLYAHWTPLTIYISFSSIGALDFTGVTNANTALKAKSINYDEIFGTLPTTSANGYTFVKWYYEKINVDNGNLEKIELKATDKCLFTANTVIYAEFDLNVYTITYITNGGTFENGTTSGDKITYTVEESFKLEIPNKAESFFKGWSDTNNATNAVINYKVAKGTTGNLTFYAFWDNYLYISFDGNGADNAGAMSNVVYTESGFIPNNLFTRKGYDFVGWKVNSSQADLEVNDSLSGLDLIANNAQMNALSSYTDNAIVLYATWKKATWYNYIDNKINNLHESITLTESGNIVMINTADDLALLMYNVNNGTSYSGKTIRLFNNIDMSAKAWTPMGNGSNPLNANFDGNNRYISGLVCENYGSMHNGFIGVAYGTSNIMNIQNLTIKNSIFTGTGSYYGALMGYASSININNVKIENDVSVSTTGIDVAGIIGLAEFSVTVKNSTNYANLSSTASGNACVAGIVGHYAANEGYNLTIDNCKNYASFDVYNMAGGILGESRGTSSKASIISNSTNYGNMSAVLCTAGIVGKWGSSSPLTITNCTNEGHIRDTSTDEKSYIAGIVAISATSPITITDCINNGEIASYTLSGEIRTYLSQYSVGGIAGEIRVNGSVINGCVNNGDINVYNGVRGVGGIVGYSIGSITFNSSSLQKQTINNGNIISHNNVGGIIGGGAAGVTLDIYNVKNTGNITSTTTGNKEIGGIIGHPQGETTIDHAENSGNITNAGCYTGGISGRFLVDYALTITNCKNSGVISATGDDFGGIISIINTTNVANSVITIANCINDGNVSSNAGFGAGIIGDAYQCKSISISDCINSGDISGTSNLSGIVGRIQNISTATISNCTNSGNVTGTERIGGIVGYLNSTTNTLTNLSNSGKIIGTGSYVAGIAGLLDKATTLTDCNNANKIKGDLYVGGIVGLGNVSTIMTNCTNDTNGEVEANGLVGGIAGQLSLATLKGLTNRGKVTSLTYCNDWDSEVAGVVARIFAGGSTLTDCYNYGDVTNTANGRACVGGIVSWGETSATVTNCHNYGNITSLSGQFVAGIWAWNTNDPSSENFVKFINCSNNGTISGTSDYAGGIMGCGRAILENCLNTGKVSAYNCSGGIVGKNYYNGTAIGFTSCKNTGNITGNNCVGGIAGLSLNEFKNCSNSGLISAVYNAGGIVGETYRGISGCVNDGNVIISLDGAGGIVGSIQYNEIIDCVNNGDVRGASIIGGIVGVTQGSLTNNKNYGNISGYYYVAGIVGNAKGGGSIIDCQNEGSVSGSGQYTAGIVGLIDTNEMLIKDCINKGPITNTRNTGNELSSVGGIVGSTSVALSILNCDNHGSVTANDYVNGGILGDATGASESAKITKLIIQNCNNFGNVKTATSYVGGILGRACLVSDAVQILNCTNSGNVTAEKTNAGGLIGVIQANFIISGCTNGGKVIANGKGINDSWAGGILARIETSGLTGQIMNTPNNGDVVAESNLNAHTGGILGNLISGTSVTLTNCTNTGAITGVTIVGGLVGNSDSSSSVTINGCLNSGTLTRTDTTTEIRAVGGLIAYADGTVSISRSSNTGSITANNSNVGGIIGYYNGALTLNSLTNSGNITNEITLTLAENTNIATGGIIGYSGNALTLNDCRNNGAINVTISANVTNAKAYLAVGGLVGLVNSNAVNVTNSLNANAISLRGSGLGAQTFVAGIVGYAKASQAYLNVTNSGNITGYGYIGGITSRTAVNTPNTITFLECTNSGSVIGTFCYVGGLIGMVSLKSSFISCANTGYIEGTGDVAGVVGRINYFASTLDNVVNSGDVHSIGQVSDNSIDTRVAGICGSMDVAGSTLNNCSNYGEISSTVKNCVAGVVAWGGKKTILTNCNNYGNITSPVDNLVAGIWGWNSNVVGTANAIELTNCNNYGIITSNGTHNGGIVAKASAILKDCNNYGQVSGVSQTAGIIGQNWYNSASITAITNCINEADISGTALDIAGICGNTNCAIISNCVNKGTITSEGQTVGGIVGWFANATITSCENYGDVNGTRYIGGITGLNGSDDGTSTSISIINCSNYGDINPSSITADNYAAGVAGWIRKMTKPCYISNCYNGGAINGSYRVVGGFVGYNNASLSITNCTNDGNIMSAGYGSGILSYTTEGVTISKCTNNGKVNNSSDTVPNAGILAYYQNNTNTATLTTNFSTSIISCVNNGAINACHTGGIFGDNQNGTTVTLRDCINYAPITSTKYCSGGVVSATHGTVYLYSCTNMGDVIGTLEGGGVVGWANSSTSRVYMYDCLNYGNVSVNHMAGGLAGSAHDGEIFNSTNYGNVIVKSGVSATVEGYSFGGVVGEVGGVISIKNCVNKGNVTGLLNKIGGIAGNVLNQASTIVNCYNSGNVTGDTAITNWGVGGIVGNCFGAITNSYNLGNVNGNNNIGGIAGVCDSASAIVTNSYSVGVITSGGGGNYGGGVAGLIKNSGTIKYSYYLDSSCARGFINSGGIAPTNCVAFSSTTTTFNGYSSNKVLLDQLNAWVNANKGTNSALKNWEKSSIYPTFTNIAVSSNTLWTAVVTAQPSGFTVSGSNITISNAEGLAWLAKQVNAGTTYSGYTVTLSNDIDLSGYNWDPIGYWSTGSFQGIFDGNNKYISNMNIATYRDGAGLFGYVQNATIKNVTVSGIIESANNGLIGMLVGVLNTATIQNVNTLGTITQTNINSSGFEEVGGMIGWVNGTLTLSNGTSNVNITSSANRVGGIVGYGGSGTVNISNSTNNGTITSSSYDVGGFLGVANICTISNSVNTGNITGSYDVGGFLGGNTGNITLNNCTNNGDITDTASTQYSGGIVGYVNGGTNNQLTDCVNNGNVYARLCAGITGYTQTNTTTIYTRCVNNGAITGRIAEAGGMIGFTRGYSYFYYCVNNGKITPGSAGGGGIVGHTLTDDKNAGAYIENCYNTGEIIANVDSCGGLVGIVSNLRIYNSYNTGKVYAPNTKNIGGIIGIIEAGGALDNIVSNCYNTGEIISNRYVGGIVGYSISAVSNKKVQISDCYNTGKIFSNGIYAAGIAGYSILNVVNAKCEIYNCYNAGNIEVVGAEGSDYRSYIAGIVTRVTTGQVEGCESRVYNCFNSGDIKGGKNGSNIGIMVSGIVGEVAWYSNNGNSYIDNCYNTGKITRGDDSLGRQIIWSNWYNSSIVTSVPANHIHNCYYNSAYSVGFGHDTNDAGHDSSGHSAFSVGANGSIALGTNVTINGVVYTDLLSVLNAWVNANPGTKATNWVMKNGMPTLQKSTALWTDIVSSQPDTFAVNGNNITISDAYGLAWLAKQVNAGTTFSGKTITLSRDIDLSGYNWDPIGHYSSNVNAVFQGIFDGANHSISNMNIVAYRSGVGLFGYSTNNTIKNLKLSGNIEMQYGLGGMLVGNCRNATITNVVTKGHITSTIGVVEYASCSGMLGWVYNGLNMSDCTSYVDIYALHDHVGGLIGNDDSKIALTLTNCYNYGTINSTSQYVGGLIGVSKSVIFANCANYGDINTLINVDNSLSANVGGGIGRLYTGSTLTGSFTNFGNVCYALDNGGGVIGYVDGNVNISNATLTNNGSVTINRYHSGGIIGSLTGSIVDSTLINNGNISASNGNSVGGILGYIDGGTVSGTFVNYGDVYAYGYHAGGIVGYIISETSLTGCVNYGNVCVGIEGVGGIIGTTTANCTITNCNNYGSVKSHYVTAGGIAGLISSSGTITIVNCTNTSSVTAGTDYAGGLVGHVAGTATISSCRNLGEVVTAGTHKGDEIGG